MSADWLLDGVSVYTEGNAERKLLHEVHASFQAGKITLLIGKNGAGKSTLLETMAGLRAVRDGSIRLGEDSLWQPHRRNKRLNRDVLLRLGISMQHSESQWFAATVREEFQYSLKPYALDKATAAQRINRSLANVGLEEAVLERDPWTLSGGQQRRLSLACLLACEPEWLLLDEPTAGLDAAGISRLCAVLQAHRAAGRGAVVATHDLDALLPLADALAVVSGGAVREAAAAAAALSHAAAAPQALRALAELRAAGAAVPPETAPREGAPWPAPREIAAALAAAMLAKPACARAAVSAAVVQPVSTAPVPQAAGMQLASAAPAPQDAGMQLASAAPAPQDAGMQLVSVSPPFGADEQAAAADDSQMTSSVITASAGGLRSHSYEPQSESWAITTPAEGFRSHNHNPQSESSAIPTPAGALRSHSYDPRALIAVYFLLAAGIFTQRTLLETGIAAGLILPLLVPFRAFLKPWTGMIRAYAVLIVIFCVIGGISLSPLSFDGEKALPILIRFSKLLLIMLIGMPMLKLMSPMRLQRAIEQTFDWLSRLHVPIHSFALLVTLIFRFIPLLMGEWERFAKLAHARGKAVTPVKSVPVRMLRAILIPYVRSMLRMAEQMADALEARGFGYTKRKPVYGFRLRVGGLDVKLLGVAALASVLLFLIAFFL
ncbi:ATP-binding cassette domain-containing protein [Paenibacillus harenae]|uniref:ATP-binding cassette domain-containing protein n=1 Tax=Paenibacillus harenae TaxID=306543 RepID=UPI0003F63F57|nr:ATP-binding cassette domain-containing protein [Paenibacillus harenae]